MVNLIWGSSFNRAYKTATRANPNLKPKLLRHWRRSLTIPFAPSLRAHKLKGKLESLWAFVVEYECRIVFQFLEQGDVLLIDIGKHDEVY